MCGYFVFYLLYTGLNEELCRNVFSGWLYFYMNELFYASPLDYGYYLIITWILKKMYYNVTLKRKPII